MKKLVFSKIQILLSIIILLSSILVLYFSFHPQNLPFIEKYPEANYLKDRQMDFQQLKAYFVKLANEKDAVYSLKVLNIISIPNDTNIHLLAHYVADELYRQKGIEGMKYCTKDFRNACSHAIVSAFFYDNGEDSIDKIPSICKQAPGPGAYSLCFHGLGHGIFAYSGYDIPRATALCKQATNNGTYQEEYSECIGGAFMEQVRGGDHDPNLWAAKRKVNLQANNPLSTCLNNFTDDLAKKACFYYLTPYLWEINGRTATIPSQDTLIHSFGVCNSIPLENSEERDFCFGGFGKEFVSLAKGRDIRNINKLTEKEMQQIYSWCLLAPAKDGQKSCISFAQKSIYWYGAVDKSIVENFCNVVTDPELKKHCFEKLNILKPDQPTFYIQAFYREYAKNLKLI